jgi:hypothetical protein
MNKKDIEKKLLTAEQQLAVRQGLKGSFLSAFSKGGTVPLGESGSIITKISNEIADSIIEDTQKILLQNTVFDDIVKNGTSPKKKKKVVKKLLKKKK